MKNLKISILTFFFNFSLAIWSGDVSMAACGDELACGSWKGVDGYHNGDYHAGEDPNPDDDIWTCGPLTEHGHSYQCVQYVNRFYNEAGMRNSIYSGDANGYYGNAGTFGLKSYPNDGEEPPKANDILCYDGGTHGHVAIVTGVILESENNYRIDIVEQNWAEDGCISIDMDYNPSTKEYHVDNRGSYWVQGWLRIPYSCKLNTQSPSDMKVVHPGETHTFIVSYENTMPPPASNLLKTVGALDWKNSSIDGENMSEAEIETFDASSKFFRYIELHSCDKNGAPAQSWLYPGDDVWVSNDKIRVVSQNAPNVGYSQKAWFFFTGKIPENAQPNDYNIYFRPYHATAGYLENWGEMHFMLRVTNGDYTVGQDAPEEVLDLFVEKFTGFEGSLGAPTSVVASATSGFGTIGYYQRFENGSIQVHSGNAYVVLNEIYDEWGEHGYAKWAGFPISDAYAMANGSIQDFEAGHMLSNGTVAEFISTTHPLNLAVELISNKKGEINESREPSIDSVHLKWNNRVSASGIKIYRRGNTTETIGVLGPEESSFTDYSLEQEASYTYFVRAFNNSAESPSSNQVVVNTEPTGDTIISAEYFIDNDPGFGNGTVLLADDGLFDSYREQTHLTVDTANLSIGLHTLYMRMKNDKGDWSIPRGIIFEVTGNKTVSNAEYFVDTDPGAGKGVPMSAIDGNFDEIREALGGNLDTSGLALGTHTLWIRSKYSEGEWGAARSYKFEVRNPPIIKEAEFFVDDDPGTGNGNTMEATDSSFDSSLEEVSGTIATSALNIGEHTVHVRAKDSYSRWGEAVGTTFFVTPPLPKAVTGSASGVTENTATLNGTVNPNGGETATWFEYGLDSQYESQIPGTPATLTGSGDQNVSASVSELAPGTTYHFRIKGENISGLDFGDDQTFATLASKPTVSTGEASSVTANGATLHGTVNPNGAQTTVVFEYGTTAEYGGSIPATPSPIDGSGNQSVTALATGLSLATTYHFRIKAENSEGESSGIDESFVTSAEKPAGTTKQASFVTGDSATLNATVNPNGAETTVAFEYGFDTNYGNTVSGSPSPLSGVENQSVDAQLTGLQPGASYHFRVMAQNSKGELLGDDLSFTTLAAKPSVETGLSEQVFTTKAVLFGTVNPNGASTMYRFEYGANDSYGKATSFLSAGGESRDVSVSETIYDLYPDNRYHFRLTATNIEGTSYGEDSTLDTLPVSETELFVEATGLCGGKTPCFKAMTDAIAFARDGVTLKIGEGRIQ